MIVLLLAFLSTIFWPCTECRAHVKSPSYPLDCMVRQFSFTVNITDNNGRKCRGTINTKACYGSCESYEYGTSQFPYLVSVTPVCNYDRTIEVTKTLSDCDPDVDPLAKVYKYVEAVSCVCSVCDPKEQNCNPIIKRDSKEQPTPPHEGEFGPYVQTKRRKKTGRKYRKRKPQQDFWW